ncbi:hypothetical protein D3C84_1200860 [compost metagenome]
MAFRFFRIRLKRTEQFPVRENNGVLHNLIFQTNEVGTAFKPRIYAKMLDVFPTLFRELVRKLQLVKRNVAAA